MFQVKLYPKKTVDLAVIMVSMMLFICSCSKINDFDIIEEDGTEIDNEVQKSPFSPIGIWAVTDIDNDGNAEVSGGSGIRVIVTGPGGVSASAESDSNGEWVIEFSGQTTLDGVYKATVYEKTGCTTEYFIASTFNRESINRVTHTDIVSFSEYQQGFNISGRSLPNSIIKIAIDNDRTNGLNELGEIISSIETDNSGYWLFLFGPNSIYLKTAIQGIAGSGVHRLTVWADNGNSNIDDFENPVTRLFLVAAGTAVPGQNMTKSSWSVGMDGILGTHDDVYDNLNSLSENYSVQDPVSGNVFVYYYGDPDGDGTGSFKREAGNDTDGYLDFYNYYNTKDILSQNPNNYSYKLPDVKSQVFEFSITKPIDAIGGYSWDEGLSITTQHTFCKSNYSRFPTLPEAMALLGANFIGKSSIPGPVETINLFQNGAILSEEDNQPSNWGPHGTFWCVSATLNGRSGARPWYGALIEGDAAHGFMVAYIP